MAWLKKKINGKTPCKSLSCSMPPHGSRGQEHGQDAAVWRQEEAVGEQQEARGSGLLPEVTEPQPRASRAWVRSRRAQTHSSGCGPRLRL